MFSKPLFKQSVKANGLMWAIVTLMVCFMLACVMVIGGGGNVGNVATGVTDTIITNTIESAAKKRGLSYYQNAKKGEEAFDNYFYADLKEGADKVKGYYVEVSTWMAGVEKNAFTIPLLQDHVSELPSPTDQTYKPSANLHGAFYSWINEEPATSSYDISTGEGQTSYLSAVSEWNTKMPSTELIVTLPAPLAYKSALASLRDWCLTEAQKTKADATVKDSEFLEIYGSVMVSLNPENACDDYYTNHDMAPSKAYDVTSLAAHYATDDGEKYIASDERVGYRNERASGGSSVFLGDLFTSDVVKENMITALSDYGVSEERYDSYGYDFATIEHLAHSSDVSFQSRYDYELSLIDEKKANGVYATDEDYQKAIVSMSESLTNDIGNSFLSSLPSEVSDALQEVGEMDVYSLIVGSVYFKMAGLLLPIIYVIMASNNLVSSQVDSGSMAYVLSTSTKRSTVTFTQAVYLILSILAMSLLTMITSFICFNAVTITKTSMTYQSLAFMNLGSFAVLFAIGGFNFFTSCFFDREQKSMALGGGISIFFLVSTMLGLFGSSQIPSVVRFDSLNYFNYASLISLFDVISIVDGTTTWIWKAAILIAVGLVGYVSGSLYFKKKDLPL